MEEFTQQIPRKNPYILVCLVVLLLLVVVVVFSGGGNRSSTIGDEVILRTGSQSVVWVSISKAAAEQLTKTCVAKDERGTLEQFRIGASHSVAAGTRGLVIDSSFGLRAVRILGGPYDNQVVWVPMEYAVKQ